MTGAGDYERLGAFYLGRRFEPGERATTDELVLYDSKDLTTHAVCLGMTGSGKTGLCISLLEEAAIDGVPSIVIDPKGDMANLLLHFPGLAPEEFEPWVDPRAGATPAELAKKAADLWRRGLDEWGQDAARVARLARSADFALYTPGSSVGRQLAVLRSFDAPPPAVRADREALADRVLSAVAALLGLLNVKADPMRSREGALLSNILQTEWTSGRDLELADLVRAIQSPPFERLGVLDLESFFPAKERFELAMALNGLLASPSFAEWMRGEPLDAGKLLFTDEGTPRVSVVSIAHLSDSERMFFVTTLLEEVLAWMRTQPGTSSLRALLYMDEIFGYFPPSKEPPSKRPMLTLLKQARAFGLGVVLATQNPVDLDYKGLSNCGTWFLGRLQTERDRKRVLDGLEGAGAGFDRAELERLLAGLSSRVFLMNNAHEDEPILFHTRWALSYLRGPMTREELKRLGGRSGPGHGPEGAPARATPAAKARPARTPPPERERPVLPEGVRERFLARTRDVGAGERILYRPAIGTSIEVHWANARAKVDVWKSLHATVDLTEDGAAPWEEGELRESHEPSWLADPEAGAGFAELPGAAARKTSYGKWARALKQHVYKEHALVLFKHRELRMVSAPGESEGEFRARLVHAARERRDLAIEKLRGKYAPKLERARERIRKAEARVDREEEQYEHARTSSWLSVGTTLLGGLFGRKLASATNVRRAGSAMRARSRSKQQKGDIARAQDELDSREEALADLEQELRSEVAELRAPISAGDFELEELLVRPRKSDLSVETPTLVWRPWRVGADGLAEPAFQRPAN